MKELSFGGLWMAKVATGRWRRITDHLLLIGDRFVKYNIPNELACACIVTPDDPALRTALAQWDGDIWLTPPLDQPDWPVSSSDWWKILRSKV
jgi:hypothetical protein